MTIHVLRNSGSRAGRLSGYVVKRHIPGSRDWLIESNSRFCQNSSAAAGVAKWQTHRT